ncbi:TonB-dependent receptor family protein [Mangrovitalea sediminis]|uniref:TonB-dependent receptor family protein n=1 Tax=Mangrovitalea sediminis TaxID=1982043 RepID=UPI000BE4C7DD|nr:TonB-dependent receptor [Mangrovitalea sediminis]
MHHSPFHLPPRFKRRATCLALGCTLANTVFAQGATTTTQLAPVVVTATRIPQSSFDLPLSIDSVDSQQIHQGQAQTSLSETAQRIPGVVVNDRQNYAQGPQISSRGFGARAAFGVRGVRLLMDGIPLTMPDGQGMPSVLSLGSAQRIEFLRGPFSALYGNSSGGVIQAFTADGPRTPRLSHELTLGSYSTSRNDTQLGGQAGGLNYLMDYEHFETSGYRAHSAAHWNHVNAKFRYRIDDRHNLELLLNGLDQPDTQDPLGLTRAQMEADPRQAVDKAYTYNTRKSVRHRQAGLVYNAQLTANDSLRLLGYGGQRHVTQYLPFSGTWGLSSGGVVDLNRHFQGADARWTHQTTLASTPLRWTLGLNYDGMTDRRRGFVNNNGDQGALRRDEDDTVYTIDQYLQGQWDFARRWSLTAGVRHSFVKFDSRDYFITSTNPDDSGSLRFRSTNPVIGVLYHLTPAVNLYANYGHGFETPTFAELAYRPDGSTGLNFDLKPSTSRNYETGIKAFLGDATEAKLALFHIDTHDEIVVANASAGRTSYKNGGDTRRDGVELSMQSDLDHGFSTYLAYTYLDARFNGGTLDGRQLPAVPHSDAYGELRWDASHSGFYSVLDGRVQSRVYVDDVNSASAAGYTVADWRAGFSQTPRHWRFDEFVRVNNLFDRQYVGAIVVADKNGRYYEPAPNRNFLVGVKAAYTF